MSGPGMARDGHVLDLALEQLVLGDLPDATRRTVKAHLRECELCRARAEVVRADLSVPLPPLDLALTVAPATVSAPPSRPALPSWATGALVGAGLGAVVLVVVWLRG